MGIFVAFAVGLLAVALIYRLSGTKGAAARQDLAIEEALAMTRERLRPLAAAIVAEHPEIRGMGETALRAFAQHSVVPDRRFRLLFVTMTPAVEAAVMQELRRTDALSHALRAAAHNPAR
ncbi:MAG TPA: hypothetical protein VL993_10800 [Stellaceae bacterium]|nr:hypothetical protein [Stellaceae bacterium]